MVTKYWFFFAFLLGFVNTAAAHQGPDPIAHWVFNSRSVMEGTCYARLGPDLRIDGEAQIVSDPLGESLDLTGWNRVTVVGGTQEEVRDALPVKALTVSAWVMIDEAEKKGEILGVVEAEGQAEGGWVLGYNSEVFTFALASEEGADQHHRSQILGTTPYEKGQWFHVVGVYDGHKMELYVNGKLEAQSNESSGPIRYPDQLLASIVGRPVPGGSHPLRGRLREMSVYDMAARAEWVQHEFSHEDKLVALKRDAREDSLTMVVEPYLQYGTTDGMTVMWQTTRPGSSIVHYGETIECEQTATGDEATIHEVRIEGLKAETQYFYQVETVDKLDRSVGSSPSTFSTAVLEGTPFAFAVISDTQFNPIVAGRLTKFAWAQRPSFLLHPGDLVDTGVNDSHWTQHFFPSMQELISRVPLFPVLGNHEQNSSNYYEYMSLPEPEYYYDFGYGDAHFFMIDTNRNVGPGSEQYEWLSKKLEECDSSWKFVCHHHPPYSSDENDYGDLWKTNKSTRGDIRARQLSSLYDKYKVDVVWNGHIHSYERTWPVRDGKAVSKEGPIYMIVGGGGGSLETPGPYRPFFQNQVRRGHHYVMVHVNGTTLELRSYDLDDHLFDTVRLQKDDE